MIVFESKEELNSYLGKDKTLKTRVGLVPTMGALHAGHLALVEQAVLNNDLAIVSIFVNPTQFNDPGDLNTYPRSLKSDLKKLKSVKGKICVFAPTIKEMYPSGLIIEQYPLNGLDKVMEGVYRKSHFNGVCTVVETLLRVVNPDVAYFGEKDFQQLQIIRKMVAYKNILVAIEGCPIVREKSGLAMSSRNEKLTEPLRRVASFIYNVLQDAKQKFGTKSADYVKKWVQKEFKKHPEFKLEYIEITDELTLTPVKRKNKSVKYRAFIAAYLGGVRLIDNIPLY